MRLNALGLNDAKAHPVFPHETALIIEVRLGFAEPDYTADIPPMSARGNCFQPGQVPCHSDWTSSDVAEMCQDALNEDSKNQTYTHTQTSIIYIM